MLGFKEYNQFVNQFHPAIKLPTLHVINHLNHFLCLSAGMSQKEQNANLLFLNSAASLISDVLTALMLSRMWEEGSVKHCRQLYFIGSHISYTTLVKHSQSDTQFKMHSLKSNVYHC